MLRNEDLKKVGKVSQKIDWEERKIGKRFEKCWEVILQELLDENLLMI